MSRAHARVVVAALVLAACVTSCRRTPEYDDRPVAPAPADATLPVNTVTARNKVPVNAPIGPDYVAPVVPPAMRLAASRDGIDLYVWCNPRNGDVVYVSQGFRSGGVTVVNHSARCR